MMNLSIEREEIGKKFEYDMQKINHSLEAKLNKLTYRQYLALVLIVTKLDADSVYPSKDELKETIGFKTDRMLKVTLDALDKKGFININRLDSEILLSITEETKKALPILIDKLFLIKERAPYSEVQSKITHEIKKNYLNISIEQPIAMDKGYIQSLNNKRQIFNRWYTLLEDFPPSLVWDRLNKYGVNPEDTVLDPYCGSGTTVVTAKLYGSKCIGVDVNPVATFVTRVKTTWNVNFHDLKIEANSILNELHEVSSILKEVRITTPALMNIPKMERYQWLKPYNQNIVAFVKERLYEVRDEDLRNIFLLALVEAAQESSNVSFCPGTSFYPFKKRPTFFDAFKQKLEMMYKDLKLIKAHDLIFGDRVSIFTEDMRKMTEFIESGSINFIFTSPPYPNDLEYTRQTRLDLYLLDFIKNMEDVTEIKKKMVKGSTKLIYKESNNAKYVEDFPYVAGIVDKMEDAFKDKKWGWDYPRMILEYFGDIFLAMVQTREVLKEGCYAQFVVGDQTYKQILIPVGKIMVKMAKELNYSSSNLETFRVRRSTLHDIPLKEEIVVLRK